MLHLSGGRLGHTEQRNRATIRLKLVKGNKEQTWANQKRKLGHCNWEWAGRKVMGSRMGKGSITETLVEARLGRGWRRYGWSEAANRGSELRWSLPVGARSPVVMFLRP